MNDALARLTDPWRCVMRGPVVHGVAFSVLLGLLPGHGLMAQTPAQAPAPVTAIRAGRLLDPEAGRILTNQVILVEGTRIRDVGPNVAIPAGAQVIDLSAMTVMPGPRRSAQSSRAHLQAGAREQRLLLHLRAGIDGAARDPGRVERHPDARVGIHDRPRHGQQRQLRRHRAAAGDRAGLDPRADDHQLRHHHRRHGRPVLPDARNGQGPQHRLSRSTSTPTRRTRSSRRCGRTCCSARG